MATLQALPEATFKAELAKPARPSSVHTTLYPSCLGFPARFGFTIYGAKLSATFIVEYSAEFYDSRDEAQVAGADRMREILSSGADFAAEHVYTWKDA